MHHFKMKHVPPRRPTQTVSSAFNPVTGTPTGTAVAPTPRILPEVQLVSGQKMKVQNALEREWFEQTRDHYMTETKFSEATDLRDLDRLLVLELMVFRWTQYLAAGQDYDGHEVDDNQLHRNIREYSDQINKVKASMSLTKAMRDAAADEGNFSAWLTNLKARAKMFGVHRENQLSKALVLFNELSAIVGSYQRSDAEERRKLGFETAEDIVEWIDKVALPEYRAIDEYFRTHQQRYWIREQ